MLHELSFRDEAWLPLASLCCVLALFCCCSSKRTSVSNGTVTDANKPEQAKMSIKITSTAFADGEMLPKQYTCDGANVSPPLSWLGVPVSAKTLALICDDPDAPGKTWVHWVAYDLPASLTSLPENIAAAELTGGGRQGTNDFKKIGYGGPCPPGGTHRYYFKLYALDGETSLQPGATKDQLLKTMEGHIVAQGQLMGRYKR
jgi:Raf kinase inhibitor-like YbhB/YbcL family protein